MILIDTDVCIEILRGNLDIIEKRKQENDKIAVSFMTVAELYYGSEKSNNPSKNSSLVDEFLLSVEIVHSDYPILKKFGNIKVSLQKAGNPLADADLFIAATTLVKCEKLITGNIEHFKRIQELKIENWIK